MEIRRYRPSDREQVKTLHRIALQHAGVWEDSGEWDNDLDRIEEEYLKGGEFLVIEEQGRIMAMGALKKVSDTICEMKRVRVDPGFQRRGPWAEDAG